MTENVLPKGLTGASLSTGPLISYTQYNIFIISMSDACKHQSALTLFFYFNFLVIAWDACANPTHK